MKFSLAAIKVVFAVLLGFSLMLTTSCNDDEDCISDATGTYVGTETCPGFNNNLTMTITEASEDDEVILAISGTSITITGELNDDCNSIRVPSQNVAALNGSVDGSLSINGSNLTGTLNYPGGTCSYNLSKQ